MKFRETIILIPCHSLEDFPTELEDDQAASLLNAFACAWHPLLLNATEAIPQWHRSDEPPESLEDRLIIIPTAADDWVPYDWIEQAKAAGARVVSGQTNREDYIAAIVEVAASECEFDDDLVSDFIALGTCYLQTELLARHMHHFSSIDEVHLQREAVQAAVDCLNSDADSCREHLKVCFERLTESRERFYPVECYLLDLCLLMPDLADDNLRRWLERASPANLLVTGKEFREICDNDPELGGQISRAWQEQTIDIIGGELTPPPIPVVPMESILWNFRAGQAYFREACGKVPRTWSRRRFGLGVQIPQILNRFGYQGVLHLLLDDGIYPDHEQSRIRWEGIDGSVISAITRIPLAADSTSSYLRFSQRMAESMEEDQSAAVILARWPDVQAPWFEDFVRISEYSPALGRFITFEEFFELDESPRRLSSYEAKEYLSPFLTHAVVRQEPNPVTRFRDHFLRRRQFDTGHWLQSLAVALTGRPIPDALLADEERVIEQGGPDGTPTEIDAAVQMLEGFVERSAEDLVKIVMAGGGDQPGMLLINTLSFPRRVVFPLDQAEYPPEVGGAIRAVQFDDKSKIAIVDLPAAGFTWLPTASANAKPTESSVPLVEEHMLRNEYFEAHINPETGGIQRIKEYGRRPNRLSQQLAFRFAQPRTIQPGDDYDESETTSYSEMRCQSVEVISDGPVAGIIETRGELIDPETDEPLAGFCQRFRMYRGRPVLEIEVELDIAEPMEGIPWLTYFGSRWAWNNSSEVITRSIFEEASTSLGERFESPHYIEFADEEQRTTILTHGLPFHRKTGSRMLDTILVVEGETTRKFRFDVVVDRHFPMQDALDAMTPALSVPTTTGPPNAGTSGWFFHVDARNVQITRIMGLATRIPEGATESWEWYNSEGEASDNGIGLRLVETEGRRCTAKLRCFRTPIRARQRDFQGKTVTDLTIQGETVVIEMTSYEIADVELRFGDD